VYKRQPQNPMVHIDLIPFTQQLQKLGFGHLYFKVL
jgi:hypothetical protein